MKKVILFLAVAAALSGCGGGGGGDNGGGSVAGVPADPVPAGQGNTFVTAVLGVINTPNADVIGTADSQATYDGIEETTSDFTLPDTLA